MKIKPINSIPRLSGKIYLLFLLVLCGLCSLTHAYYPLGLYHADGETAYPIVGVKNSKPIALKKGKEISVEADTITFKRLDIYQTGSIEIADEDFHVWNSNIRSIQSRDGVGDGQAPNRGFVEFSVQSSRDFSNVYVVVFSGTGVALSAQDVSELYITYSHIGDLKSGIKKEINLTTPFPNTLERNRKLGFFAVLYEDGLPIRSELDGAILGHFMLREQKAFKAAKADYLAKNAGKTKKHESYYSFMPYLPKELYDETGPIDAKVTFKISDKGYVSVEKIEGIKNEEATEFIKARLSEWFFYPKLENGQPVATRTATRIKF